MYFYLIFTLATSVAAITTQDATTTEADHLPTPRIRARNPAINPTRADQIGVNPVTIYEHPTPVPLVPSRPVIHHVTTVDGATTTVTAPWAVETLENGDVTFPITPEGQGELQGIFDEVAAACAGAAKVRRGTLHKRTGACELDRFVKMASGRGKLAFSMGSKIVIPAFTAGDVSVALNAVPASAAIAFIAYVIGNGQVSSDSAPKVAANQIVKVDDGDSGAETTTKVRRVTTPMDLIDEFYTADDNLYSSMAQAIVKNLSDNADAIDALFEPQSKPETTCDESNTIDMEQSFFQDMATEFCKDMDLAKDKSADLTNADVGKDAFDGYTLHFDWKHSDKDCRNLQCEGLFKDFSTSCKGINSHVMFKSGSKEDGCGWKASFEIKKDEEEEPEPTSAPEPLKLGEATCGFSYEFDSATVENSIETYCGKITDDPGLSNNGLFVWKFLDVKSKDGTECLALQASQTQEACPQGAENKVDWKALGKDRCKENFMKVASHCPRGGTVNDDCLVWLISSPPV